MVILRLIALDELLELDWAKAPLAHKPIRANKVLRKTIFEKSELERFMINAISVTCYGVGDPKLTHPA